MSNFELITSSYSLLVKTAWYWDKFGPGGVDRIKDTTPIPNMPLLMAPYISAVNVRTGPISYRVAKIICTKKDAKRIIYPKTNGLKRGNSYAFSWFRDNIEKRIDNFIQSKLRQTKIDPLGLVQSRYIEEVMIKAKNAEGPVLISYYSHMSPKKVIEFFLVNREDASKLVYYDKNKPRDQLQEQPEEQPVKAQEAVRPIGNFGLEPYNIIVSDRNGVSTVFVQLPDSFNDQSHVPRFKLGAADRVERGIRKWEALSLSEINYRLKNSEMPVDATVAMAHRVTKEFLEMRRRMRLNKMLNYQANCTNVYTVLSNPLMERTLQNIQKKRKTIAGYAA